jgi:hypothetical protein
MKETAMVQRAMRRALIFLAGISAAAAFPSAAQQPAVGTKAVQVTGLTGVKPNAKGNLTSANGNLEFEQPKAKVTVPIHSVEDVITGADSQRVFRGTFGTLTLLAPYGGGRFLSLFRGKLETLTIQYRDADGGLHGAIFTMALGKAEPFKKDLVAQGARTSVPVQDDAGSSNAQEKKP